MKRLSPKEIQLRALDILLQVDAFCKEQGLTYYLAAGTLLGAVRHQGFIPWDDDADICMARPDYEKFVKTFPANENLKVISSSLGNWEAPYAKVVDTSTEVRGIFNEAEKHLWLDVFPVDGLPAEEKRAEKIYRDCGICRSLFCVGSARLGEGKTVLRKYVKYLLKPLVQMYGNEKLARKIEEIAARHPYESSEYVGNVTWGIYGIGERMKKSEYEKAVTVEFEGHTFPAMSCWDSYLTGIYGDYMTPPPPEKRKTHDMAVYVKD